jgi:hypothetical protein
VKFFILAVQPENTKNPKKPSERGKFPTISAMTSKGLITSSWESTSNQSRTKIDFLKIAHIFLGEGKRVQMRQQEDKNPTLRLAAYLHDKRIQALLLLHLQVFEPHN